MKHSKTYDREELIVNNKTILLEGPISSQAVLDYQFHPGLVAFRPPEDQQKALASIADLPEGRIIVAVDDGMVVGYVTYVYPDPLERWSESPLDNLLELGAVEVAYEYRGGKVGSKLIQLSMRDDAMEDYIIITTEYYWHWDLKSTGLSVWEYRKLMEKMMNSGGLYWMATDDPEISSHPANCLMVRIGSRVPMEDVQEFDNIRFVNRFMY
ncbi:acetyltransferase AcuA, acetyl-CoA synthetase inhibitor [Geomicrobium sp. JCM 19037]|uniref:GNAT family N-acetyltransferase n=1 Tax=unclassified Geomicrobium TaxID=2628951 RepID=UPI00045F37DE|nr:GNAT family N-acetyltransferase [Geomicrobium sp. JCM 19037]GAK02878.1 acetyltransferase AcuA, acetyl-CoA synthetase inhibitor [Geomicrobium sp. JCM 19037]